MNCLARIGRRHTAWETDDVSKIVKTEFQTDDGPVDLELSVFQIDEATEATQTHAEFSASHLNPPSRFLRVNLFGLREAQNEVGETAFVFTRERHRFVRLNDEADVRSLILGIKREAKVRAGSSSKLDVAEYVVQRLDGHDPEWAACERRKKWEDWARKIVRNAVARRP